SRRRHTRWPRDWSSDVCSSDLRKCARWSQYFAAQQRDVGREQARPAGGDSGERDWEPAGRDPGPAEALHLEETLAEVLRGLTPEIGRASCRERESSRVRTGCSK